MTLDIDTNANTNESSISPLVAILLCTYNGGRFLAAQLDSFCAQEHQYFEIWASDDGSYDNTLEILKQYQAVLGESRLTILRGPRQGGIKNFLSLIRRKKIQADYFAYADQDDIWLPDKLSRAVLKLSQVDTDVPGLYCSRTRLIDEAGRELGLSQLHDRRSPGFANALVQNIAGGNTMVMNNAARNLMRAVDGSIEVSHHDWWAYMLVTGTGGTVVYDSQPTISYRQHSENLIGSNQGLANRIARIRALLDGVLRGWIDKNTSALMEIRLLLTSENQAVLDEFCAARNRWLIPRVWGVVRSGIYRQTRLGNLGLILAVIMKKV